MPSDPTWSSSFLHERMRELSKQPLPVWPVVLLAYLACPLLFFVILPAAIDFQWLRLAPAIPSVLMDSHGEESLN